MASVTNFAYAATLDGFKEALSAGTVDENSIVFIEETNQIWTHGIYFQFDTDS